MFDLHCHILHQIDDGAELLETSGDMAKALVASGFTDVLCTPHMPGLGMMPLTKDRILDRFQQLQGYLQQEAIPLNIHMSAEHNLQPILLQEMDKCLVPFGAGTEQALLIELPWGEVSKKYLDGLIFELQCSGYGLLLAHPERSPGYSLDWLESKVNAGNFFLQIEIGSLCGQYGPKAKSKALELLKHHLVHVAASDCHNVANCRQMKEFVADLDLEYGSDVCKLLLHDNPHHIFNGDFELVKAV